MIYLEQSRPKGARVFAPHPEQWYVEPESVTRALLTVERFVGITWDPACGGGNICRAFAPIGHCLGTDIVQRGEGIWWKVCFDFLALGSWVPVSADNIVTNPPYFRARGTEAFIRKALEVVRGKVVVFVDVRFLSGQERANGLFADHAPSRIWHITPRPSCPPGDYLAAGNKAGGGTADYCWLVWDLTAPPGRTETGWLRRAAA